jgi:carbon-monoxide dehydrogenase small subunit
MNTLIEMTVNGERHEVAVEPYETVLGVLRDRLGLTGTKRGCDTGGCGCCTVLVEGRARYSCMTYALSVKQHAITTIEGLLRGGRLDPIQQAFIAAGAVQCGYCTPGIIMAARELLDEVPGPTDGEIRRAIAGNLCRCTGYHKIVEAIRLASAGG